MGEEKTTYQDIKGRKIAQINGKDVKGLSSSDFDAEINKTQWALKSREMSDYLFNQKRV